MRRYVGPPRVDARRFHSGQGWNPILASLGIVIPWVDRDRLAMVKIRRRTGEEPKYAEAFRDRPSIFPTPRGRSPWQAAGDRGGGVRRPLTWSGPRGPGRRRDPRFGIGPARGIDLPGDAARPGLVSRDRCRRRWRQGRLGVARPCGSRQAPGSGKDWTEAAQAGVDLRRWWTDRLGGIETGPPDPAPWKVSPSGDVERDTQSPSGTEAPAASTPWPPRPDELASWPLEWRERWGSLANDLEARGTPWPQSEVEAFRQVKGERGTYPADVHLR